MKKILTAALLAALFIPSAFAQGDALPFTKIDRNPATSGMAGAGLASSSTIAWTAFRGAAVIPFYAKNFDVAASVQSYAPDGPKSTNVAFGTAYKVSDSFGASLGVAYQAGEKYDVSDANGLITGTYSPSDMVVALGLAGGFGNFAAGLNARYASQNLADGLSFNGFSVDVYASYRILPELTAVAGLSTLGSSIEAATKEKFSQPASFALGADYNYAIDGKNALKFDVDADFFFSGNLTAALGAQYGWSDMVFVRAGYHYGAEDAVLPSFATIGAGFKYEGFRLDLAFLTANDALGNTITFGIGYSF